MVRIRFWPGLMGAGLICPRGRMDCKAGRACGSRRWVVREPGFPPARERRVRRRIAGEPGFPPARERRAESAGHRSLAWPAPFERHSRAIRTSPSRTSNATLAHPKRHSAHLTRHSRAGGNPSHHAHPQHRCSQTHKPSRLKKTDLAARSFLITACWQPSELRLQLRSRRPSSRCLRRPRTW